MLLGLLQTFLSVVLLTKAIFIGTVGLANRNSRQSGQYVLSVTKLSKLREHLLTNYYNTGHQGHSGE